MSIYARVDGGVVQEIIQPLMKDDGSEWPIADRFTADFVATLVDVTIVTPSPIPGWAYNGNAFAAPVVAALNGAELLAQNTAMQATLMNAANVATYGQADAYVAGLLDPADSATFKAWAAYKLALSKVDLTQASPVWPPV